MIVIIVSLAAVVLVIAGYVIFSKTPSLFMFKLINKIFKKKEVINKSKEQRKK